MLTVTFKYMMGTAFTKFRPFYTTSLAFDVHGSVHRKYIPIYIQQACNLTQFIYIWKHSTCFGWYNTHHQERMQLYLQHLVFVTPLLLPAVR